MLLICDAEITSNHFVLVYCIGLFLKTIYLLLPSRQKTEYPCAIHVADIDSTLTFRSVPAGLDLGRVWRLY